MLRSPVLEQSDSALVHGRSKVSKWTMVCLNQRTALTPLGIHKVYVGTI